MSKANDALERIARRPMGRLRLKQLGALKAAKEARGEALGAEDRLDLGLAGYDFGQFSFEEALCYARAMLNQETDKRIQAVYNEEYCERFEAIRQKHGLGPDEFWALGEGPEEAQSLDREFNAACDRVTLQIFQEHADRTGHPFLRQAADLLASDPHEFERRREVGRQSLFGPFKEQTDGS